MTRLFEDQAGSHEFVKDDLLGIARKTQQEITFQRFDGYTLSAADAFVLLTGAMASYLPHQQWPATTALTDVYGPAQDFRAAIGGAGAAVVSGGALGGG